MSFGLLSQCSIGFGSQGLGVYNDPPAPAPTRIVRIYPRRRLPPTQRCPCKQIFQPLRCCGRIGFY